MTKKAQKLSDFTDIEELRPTIYKPEDVFGHNVTLKGFDIRTGDLGDYALFDCDVEGKEDVHLISTGAEMVMRLAKLWDPEKDGPLVCQFAKSGRQTVLTDPREPGEDIPF